MLVSKEKKILKNPKFAPIQQEYGWLLPVKIEDLDFGEAENVEKEMESNPGVCLTGDHALKEEDLGGEVPNNSYDHFNSAQQCRLDGQVMAENFEFFFLRRISNISINYGHFKETLKDEEEHVHEDDTYDGFVEYLMMEMQ